MMAPRWPQDGQKMAPRWLKIEGDTVWACRFFAKRSPAVLPLCGLNTAGEPEGARICAVLGRKDSSACKTPGLARCLVACRGCAPCRHPLPSCLRASWQASFSHSFLVSFLYTFLEEFWRQNGSKNGSKIAPKSAIFWAQILYRFFCVLGALWVPLGSLLGPPKALLGGLWTPKTIKKNNCFLGILQMPLF